MVQHVINSVGPGTKCEYQYFYLKSRQLPSGQGPVFASGGSAGVSWFFIFYVFGYEQWGGMRDRLLDWDLVCSYAGATQVCWGKERTKPIFSFF